MNTWQSWVGRAIGALVVAILLADAATALLSPTTLAAQMAETGFPATMIAPVGVLALLSGLAYAIPRTAMLGAILITGFAGGAIAIHLRMGDVAAPPQLFCAALATLAWGGLWLRDTRLRTVLPLG